MRYFDFHCHPILKQLFNEEPNIDSFIYKSDVAALPRSCTDLPSIIQSQTHPAQLAEFNDEVMIGAVLYSVEKFVAKTVIPLRKFLKKSSQYKLSEKLLHEIDENINRPFSDFLMSRTLDKYLEAVSSYHILTATSFSRALPKNKVNVFFTIEGCHSLVDSNNVCNSNQQYSAKEVLNNLDLVQKKAAVIAINLTHLQPSNLCNHAFGMQLADASSFFPVGNGLQNEGRKLIQGFFDRKICVDIKHMSYLSRKNMMDEMDAGKYKNPQPVLCTHAGFTGISFKNWAGHLQLKKPVSGALYLEITKRYEDKMATFNASTINLFDEEIVWIIKNGGMIGLSMDRRILGYVDKFDDDPTGITSLNRIVDKEFFSKAEWTALGIQDAEIGAAIDDDKCLTMEILENKTENSLPERDEYFYDHILNHIRHYFQVCADAKIPVSTAQKQLVIGTDFDGLINPFVNMPTVDRMKNVRSYLSMNLKYYLNSFPDSKRWAKELDVEVFLENFFYTNGYQFIKNRFAGL